MSAKVASGITVVAAYGLLFGAAVANGCSSPGSRTTTTSSTTSTSTSSSTTPTSTATSTSTEEDSSTPTVDAAAVYDGNNCSCTFPSNVPASNGLIYNGGLLSGTFCPSSFTYDGVTNSWFSYSDGTVDASAFTTGGMAPGCGGTTSCAFYAAGQGFTNYGAGIGFTLNNNAIFDASGFTGMYAWLQGTTTGTRGPGFTSSNNTVHVKFVTALPDGGDPREGDDFGAYCVINQDAGAGCYTLCPMPFAGLTRDGYKGVDAGAPNPATDVFDPQNLVKIQFEFSSYMAEDSSVGDVGFNVSVGAAAFYIGTAP